jgi:hypothetical protein
MPSEELQAAAAGVAQGTLSFTKDTIKEWVKKLQAGRLAFIQDNDTITLVKEQLKTGEWSLCSQYIQDGDLRLLVQMGLTLRKLDQMKDEVALQNLRKKIRYKHTTKGLHIAQFVQNKILNRFVGKIIDKTSSVSELIKQIEDLLNNLDQYTAFIKTDQDAEEEATKILSRIQALVPKYFIVFTSKTAIESGVAIWKYLLSRAQEYEIVTEQDQDRFLIFLFKEETDINMFSE